MSQKKIVLKRSGIEKIIFISHTIILIFVFLSALQASQTYMALILLVLLLVFTVITFRVFTIPYFCLYDEFLFLSPVILGKTYKICMSDIKRVELIEYGKNRGFIFYMKNGTHLKYVPRMQDSKLINKIIKIIINEGMECES